MKELDSQRLAELRARMGDRTWCFFPVSTQDGWFALAVACRGQDGYEELPLEDACAESYVEMQRHADALNRELGCDGVTAARIVGETGQTAAAPRETGAS